MTIEERLELIEQVAEYSERVVEKLEYINYPDYAMHFAAEDVARAIGETIILGFRSKMSPMLIACLIFGCTWEYKIVPMTKEMVKH